MASLEKEIATLVRARYPLLYLISAEEERAEKMLGRVAESLRLRLSIWGETTGLDNRLDLAQPLLALDHVLKSGERALFLFRDFHRHLEQSAVVRKCRDLARALKQSYKTLVILSPVLALPPELEKDLTVLDVPLPDANDLYRVLDRVLNAVKNRGQFTVDMDALLREEVIKATLGLTEQEAENIFAKVVVEDRRFDRSDLPMILSEKKQLIRKSGILEYYEVADKLEDVGGLERLKGWLSERDQAFTQRARDFGLPEPKGLLLLGAQGCGKSLTAKAIAQAWQLPLLKLDVGNIFSSYIGASEGNMRRAIKSAESLAPVVLWVDEIEKGFAGAASGGATDAGTSARVLATFLTWLQEKTKPVFVIATSNRIEELPPELLRKGRFDEIFFIDLPQVAEREVILQIHLRKRGREPEKFDLPAVVPLTEGYSGAELEQLVVSALYRAFPLGRDINTQDLCECAQTSVPLSITMQEQLQALRAWARNRARPAS